MESVTVSAKIRKDLYRKLKEYGIPISKVIRKALEEEVMRREREKVRHALEIAQKILNKIPPEEIVAAIRSDREER